MVKTQVLKYINNEFVIYKKKETGMYLLNLDKSGGLDFGDLNELKLSAKENLRSILDVNKKLGRDIPKRMGLTPVKIGVLSENSKKGALHQLAIPHISKNKVITEICKMTVFVYMKKYFLQFKQKEISEPERELTVVSSDILLKDFSTFRQQEALVSSWYYDESKDIILDRHEPALVYSDVLNIEKIITTISGRERDFKYLRADIKKKQIKIDNITLVLVE